MAPDDNTESKQDPPSFFTLGHRHVVFAMGFLSFAMGYISRVDLPIAIVAMVNRSKSLRSEN